MNEKEFRIKMESGMIVVMMLLSGILATLWVGLYYLGS